MEHELGGVLLLFAILFVLLVSVLYIVAMWRIFRKCGWEGPWSLLLLVPIVDLVMLLVVAFSDSPSQKRAALYGGLSQPGQPPPPPPL